MDAEVEAAPQAGSKARIFISYSRKDMAFADRLEGALKTRGFEPLIDRAEMRRPMFRAATQLESKQTIYLVDTAGTWAAAGHGAKQGRSCGPTRRQGILDFRKR